VSLTAALVDEALPAAVLDLAAFDHNVSVVRERLAPGVTLRLATKSVRCRQALSRALEALGDRGLGLMCYAPREVAWLAERGHDDLLLAYPVARPADARPLAAAAAAGATVSVVCDHEAQLGVLSRVAVHAGVELSVVLDIDGSWRVGPAHLGVRRSPIRDPEAAVALADRVRSHEGLRLRGLMLYEAQVAGVRAHDPHKPWLAPAIRVVHARSRRLAAQRRVAVREALEAAGHRVELVNGGGTGSLDSSGHDGSCTEVTAGSALFCPHLFDGCGLPLRPAAMFALSVVRSSDPGWVTVAGGGLTASGAIGPDRQPVVHAPAGLVPTATEGFGEVQTPLRVTDGPGPSVGDVVLCRHAKAGELCERFEELLVVSGDRVVDRWSTYRGEGLCAP
jgi:D-serine deaminase-like pyridoxal phosphate-dependent protein